MTQYSFKTKTKGCSWILSNLNISSTYGIGELNKLSPFTKKDLVNAKACFEELKIGKTFFQKNPSQLGNFFVLFKKLRNISGTIENLRKKNILDETEFLEIKGFSIISESILELVNKIDFAASSIKLVQLQKVIKILNPEDKIIPSFHLSNSYSKKLGDLRNTRQALENQIIESSSQSKIESLKKQRSQIVQQEKEEEFIVREKLGNQIRIHLEALENNVSMLGKLELLLAKIEISLRWNSCQPVIIENEYFKTIEIEELVNPELKEVLKTTGKPFTPISISLQKGVTLLTGANMGGKTVALSTIAMNMELVSIGFFPFAKRFETGIPDFIEFVSGDGQDQQSGLSSFGAAVMELHNFISISKQGSGLVIFDEFARSTNPREGKIFVQSLCEYIQQSQSFGIVATHYDGVVLEGANYYQVVGLKDDSYTLNTEDVSHTHGKKKLISSLSEQMDYSLMKIDENYEVPKDALKIAKLLNLDEEFLKIIGKYYQ